MHSGQSAHTVEHEGFTPQVADLKRDRETGSKERQLPKLNVAGSIPVSRSRFLVGTLLCSVPDAKNLYGALAHTVNGDIG